MITARLALRSFGMGAATGLRSMTGPAFAFGGRWSGLLRVAALGEYVVDKLPNTPARTIPLALGVRAVAAGLAGASVAEDDRLLGAVCGIAGAMAAAYAGVAYREAARTRHVPPLAAALVEDGAAMALAWSVRPHKRGDGS